MRSTKKWVGRRLVTCGSLACIAVAVRAGQADAPRWDADPTVAEVPPPLPLVDPYSDDIYAKLYAHALRAVGPAIADAPVTGVRVTGVMPLGPGAKAGLHEGDIIVAIDGEPTPTTDAARAARRAAPGATKFEVLPIDAPERKTVVVEPGRLGIDIEDAWLLDAQYVRDLPAGAKPLDEVRVAARYATINPSLALAALAHAQKIGGAAAAAGPIVDAIAAVVLYDDNRYEGALSHAEAAVKHLPAGDRAKLLPIIVNSAMATARYPLVDAIAEKDNRFADALANTSSVELETFGGKKHAAPEPNPTAAGVAFVDRTKDAINLAPHVNGEFESTAWSLPFLVAGKTIPFRTHDGVYTVIDCGPGDANIDFSTDCQFTAGDDGHSGFVKVVRIGFHAANAPGKILELYVDGSADVVGEPGTPTVKLDFKRLIGAYRPFSVRMCVVGDRYEFVIDGRRVYYGPMPTALPEEKRELTLAIQTVGVGGTFCNTKWRTAPAR